MAQWWISCSPTCRLGFDPLPPPFLHKFTSFPLTSRIAAGCPVFFVSMSGSIPVSIKNSSLVHYRFDYLITGLLSWKDSGMATQWCPYPAVMSALQRIAIATSRRFKHDFESHHYIIMHKHDFELHHYIIVHANCIVAMVNHFNGTIKYILMEPLASGQWTW